MNQPLTFHIGHDDMPEQGNDQIRQRTHNISMEAWILSELTRPWECNKSNLTYFLAPWFLYVIKYNYLHNSENQYFKRKEVFGRKYLELLHFANHQENFCSF